MDLSTHPFITTLRQKFDFMGGNITVLSITDLLGNFSRRLVFPYVSLYILALGGQAAEIGLVTALAPLAGLIMFPLGGYIADHANRVKLIVLANLFSAGIVLMRASAPNWQVFALAAVLQGVVAVQFPARSALIADALSPKNRGKGIATMNTISNTVAVFAPFMAGLVIDRLGPNFGVRILYAVMMAVQAASAVVHARFLSDTSQHAEHHFKLADLPNVLKQAYSGIPQLLRQLPPSLKALAGVIVFSFMANGVASPFWVVYAVAEIGLSASAWGLILLLETVVKLVMFIPAGLLVDRWGRTSSLLVSLLIALLFIPYFAFVTDFTAALVARIAISIAFVLAGTAATALMADTVPRHMRGRIMSALGQGSIMIGPAGGGTGGPAMGYIITIPLMLSSLAGGYLYAWNPSYTWFFVGLVTALSILLVIFFIRDPHTAEV